MGDDVMRVSNSLCVTITFLVFVSILSNYVFGLTGVGVIDDLAILMCLVLSVFAFLARGKLAVFRLEAGYLFWLASTFLIFFVFLFNDFLSFIYEFYKLFSFLLLVPLYFVMSRLEVAKVDLWIYKCLLIVMSVNLSVIFLQYTVSPEVIYLLGYDSSQIFDASKAGRYVGLFESVNVLGMVSLLAFVISRLENREKGFNALGLVAVISLLVSTSKFSIGLFVLFLLIEKKRTISEYFKYALYVGALLSLAVVFNYEDISIKWNQYKNMASLFSLHFDVNPLYFELRAIYFNMAINIFSDNLFGLGLGTWGDYSSTLNPNYHFYEPVSMSDSAFSHHLVEQGVFFVLYYGNFLLIWRCASPENKRKSAVLGVMIVLSFLPYMGLSSSSWPILVAYLFARFMRTTEVVSPAVAHNG